MSVHAHKKPLNALLLLSFQLGFLEWGGSNSSFVFQAELEIFTKATGNISHAFHPLIVIPLIGVVLLIITFFQHEVSRRLTLFGLACLSPLMIMILLIAIIGLNIRMLISVIPFSVVAYFIIKQKRLPT